MVASLVLVPATIISKHVLSIASQNIYEDWERESKGIRVKYTHCNDDWACAWASSNQDGLWPWWGIRVPGDLAVPDVVPVFMRSWRIWRWGLSWPLQRTTGGAGGWGGDVRLVVIRW